MNDMIDIDRFVKMELDKFERDLFENLKKCTLNLFYKISSFRKYEKDKFVKALKKRKIIFRDLEFSEDNLMFRIVEPREMTLEESQDKTLEFARNMYFVHQLNDDIQKNIKNDPNIKATIENNRKQYAKKK